MNIIIHSVYFDFNSVAKEEKKEIYATKIKHFNKFAITHVSRMTNDYVLPQLDNKRQYNTKILYYIWSQKCQAIEIISWKFKRVESSHKRGMRRISSFNLVEVHMYFFSFEYYVFVRGGTLFPLQEFFNEVAGNKFVLWKYLR